MYLGPGGEDDVHMLAWTGLATGRISESETTPHFQPWRWKTSAAARVRELWGRAPLPRVRDESVGGPTEFGILAGHLRGSIGDQGEAQERRLEKNPQKHIY